MGTDSGDTGMTRDTQKAKYSVSVVLDERCGSERRQEDVGDETVFG
jgi:hypothetical protein